MKNYYVKALCLVIMLIGWEVQVQAQGGPGLIWANSFEETGADTTVIGSGSDMGRSVIADAQGNVYTAGYITADTVDFDPGTGTDALASAGKQDMFISKQGPDGALIWVRRFGALGDDVAHALALDGLGNLYVAGKFSETVDFDPGIGLAELVSMGGSDIFILKLNTAGDYQWAKRMGGNGSDDAVDIAVDAAGNIYTTGLFSGTADFDPDPAVNYDLTANSLLLDGFISKLDADGNFVWAKPISPNPGFGLILIAGIEVSPSAKQLYLSGLFGFSDYDFDPGAGSGMLSPIGDYDIFVLKLDSAGQFGWVKQMGGAGSSAGSVDLALDAQEHVYTTGFFTSTVDFDPGPANHPRTSPNDDVFISKLDSSGNFVWVTNSTGTSDSSVVEGYSIAVDNAGNAYTTGIFENTVNFFSSGVAGDLTSNGSGWDIFLAKVDASGGFEWARQMGSPGVQCNGQAIGLDPTEELLYLTGWFNATVDFDPGPGTWELICGGAGVNGYDVFVAKYCVAAIDPLISVNGFELGTVDTYYSYQWLVNDTLITGATDRYYEVEQNGDYRVIITTEGGCIDTSDSYSVTNYTRIAGNKHLANQISIYPNPATDIVHIDAPVDVNVLISSVEGKLIRREENVRSISLEALAEGVYFLRVTDMQGQLIKVVKILKTR